VRRTEETRAKGKHGTTENSKSKPKNPKTNKYGTTDYLVKIVPLYA
jgi:hypothetical protein